MIIGLTGKNGSGKGAAADYLKSKGFVCYSLSDVLREELKRLGRDITREKLINTGQQLRRKFGPGVLAHETIKKLESGIDYVIDSFRHPAEVEVFRKRPDFRFWAVDSDDRIRFERCVKRARELEAASFELFLEVESREFNTGDKSKQDLLGTIALADAVIENNSSIGSLHDKIEEELEKIKKAGVG